MLPKHVKSISIQRKAPFGLGYENGHIAEEKLRYKLLFLQLFISHFFWAFKDNESLMSGALYVRLPEGWELGATLTSWWIA